MNKDGLVEVKNPDGSVLGYENYKAGKLDGEQVYYYPWGQIESINTFENGKLIHVARYDSFGGII